MRTAIYIDNNRVDLHEDENISVQSSVLDIKDITKNTNAFSKSFTVPATDNNNQLFKHYYNANVDNSFDARTTIDGTVELDNQVFRYGNFRLIKVVVKKGVPTDYTINFNGELISLKETLKKDELTDLDLSAFNHTYDSDTVKTGLQSSLSSGSIIYTPLIKRQLYYDSSETVDDGVEQLVNIAWGAGSYSGIRYDDLRPSIKLIDIIETIENDYSIEFSRDFFGTSEFDNLFMWLNPDKDNDIGRQTQKADFTAGDNTYVNHSTDTGTFTIEAYSEWRFTVTIWKAYGNILPAPLTLQMYVDGVLANQIEGISYAFITQGSPVTMNVSISSETLATKDVYFNIISKDDTINISWKQEKYPVGATSPTVDVTTTGQNVFTSTFTVATNIPKIKIIDFLKGLIQMFKLVIIPQDDDTIYVDTLNNYYATGTLYDVSDYIDYESYDVNRGAILNEIEMKFAEPTTILNLQFLANTGLAYGDEVFKLTDDSGELLDGDSLTFELPFEQIVYDRLSDLDDGIKTNFQYGAIIDESLEAVNPKPHIHYNIPQNIDIKPIAFRGGLLATSKELLVGNMNIPSHVEQNIDQNYSTTFGEEFNEWEGYIIDDTLYSNHYESYITDIFNIKKRTWKYKARLPINIINKLELNDTLEIKGNYYRIDKFVHNLLTGETELELVNSFADSINPFTTLTKSVYSDYTAKTETKQISNLSGASIVKTDQGFGTGWATVTESGNTLSIALTENTTDAKRSMLVTVTQSGVDIKIYVDQTAETYIPQLDFSLANNSQYIATTIVRQ